MTILESARRAAQKEQEERKNGNINATTKTDTTTKKTSILESAYKAAAKENPKKYGERTTPTRSSPASDLISRSLKNIAQSEYSSPSTTKTSTTNTDRNLSASYTNNRNKGKAPKETTYKNPRVEMKNRYREQLSADNKALNTEDENDVTAVSTPPSQFVIDANKAYSAAKEKANAKTKIESDLSDDERNARIKEIKSELTQRKSFATGYSRGNVDNEQSRSNAEKIAELEEELKSLERVGEFSTTEMMQWEIDDARADMQSNLSEISKRPTFADVETFRSDIAEYSKAKNELESLENKQALYEGIEKYGDVVHEDTFTGQTRANYRSADISRDADKAFNEYIMNPTEENRDIAYAYDAFSRAYMENNENALDDENIKFGLISKSAAGYMPQFLDQIAPQTIGGLVGTGVGSLVGMPTAGAALGAGLATTGQSYGVIRGSVFRTLLAEGIDEEIALQAANDEALISSIIEGGETMLSVLASGGTKALSAIGSAAKSSVAKGSTNAATKFIAGLASKATDKAAKNAAKAVATPIWNTGLLRLAGGIAGNTASEYGEEFLQQGVSIANKERAQQDNNSGLVSSTGKLLGDIITGKNPKALAEMHQAGTEGAKIGLMFGGSNAIVNSTITHFANAKTVEEKNAIADAIAKDDEMLSAFVEVAKKQGENSVSAKIAEEIEVAKENGEVTGEQVKQLIASTNVYTDEEIKLGNEPDTIEKAARDVVTRRINAIKNDTHGITLEENLEERTRNNDDITAEEARLASGFGERGSELLAELANQSGMTFSKAKEMLENAYKEGYTNSEAETDAFASVWEKNAVVVGKLDRFTDDAQRKGMASQASVYDDGVIESEHFKKLSPQAQKMVRIVAKKLGLRAEFVDKLIVAEIDGVEHEANAQHEDGVFSRSATSENPIHEDVIHEALHRMMQVAPEETGILINALARRAEQYGRANTTDITLFGAVKVEHDNAGISMNTLGIMEEIAAREIQTIFASPKEFNAWIESLEANQQAKGNWQKIVEFIQKVIEDAKRFLSQIGMTAEEKANANKKIEQLENIKKLYGNAILASENAVNELRQAEQNSEQSTDTKAQKNTVTDGGVNFSLKGIRADSIEVYETSEEIINMSSSERKRLYVKLMSKEYAGRTARFVRNGHVYYAEFDKQNLGKPMYGDNRSSQSGLKALTRIGADGDIFDLVENATYDRSSPDTKNHAKTDYFDYFIKTVQIDNKVYNLLADVKKKYGKNGGYVYSIVLKDNKKIKAAPTKVIKNDALKVVETTSSAGQSVTSDTSSAGNSISQNGKDVNTNFSLKKTNNTATSKDVQKLLDTIEHLKSEFEVTKFAKSDPKELAKMTKTLLKDYNSTWEYDQAFAAIDELYQYMANGEDGHPAVWEDVYEKAYGIAYEIVERASVVDNELYHEYKGLRAYLRSTPMKFDASIDEVPSDYENFNDFHKKNFGRILFTNDGTSVDTIYQELSTLYPEYFNAEEQTDTAAMLERIVEVLDEIQPFEVNPFSQDIKSATAYLANDITSRFFDVPQAQPTFADKAERRVTEARIAGAKKLEKIRAEKNARIKEVIAEQKKTARERLDKLRTEKNAKIKQEQVKRREAISKMSEKQKAKVLRAQIIRHVGELSRKLLKPTDNQHIPQDFQGAVARLLESINLESNFEVAYGTDGLYHRVKPNTVPGAEPTQRTKAFGELRDIYEKMASDLTVDPNLMGADGLLSNVISLADKRIADMTSDELDTVWQTIRAVEATVNNANKMFASERFTAISEIADKLRTDNAGKNVKKELNKKYGGSFQKLTTLDMLTPETFFHYLGNAGDEIFRMMRNAQDKHISIMKVVADFTREALKGVNVNKLEKTLHTVTLGGQNVKLTTAQLMELYVLMKRKQATDHIFVGGILPDVIDAKGIFKERRAEPIKNISMAEINDALSNLTDEQKKIADEMQKFVSTVLSDYGNEASMQVYNYEKFNEENYWTIRTNKQEIASDPGKDTAVTTVANKGFTKGTKPNANTSIRIGSIFDTFASHSSEMATYAAWLGASEDINRIRNFVFWEDGLRTGTVKGILETVHGTQGSAYLQKLLTDIAIGVKGADNMNPFDKLVGSYKAASVGANLRVIIQQPTALLRALDMINGVYLTEGAINPLKGWEKAKKYAPIAQWKDWGHFDINTGRQMKDVLFDNATLGERLRQAGMWGASMADSISWGMLWNAVEAETKAKHKDLKVGSDEYYKAVAERFTQIVDHTQVVDGILQRSQIMRSSDSLTKMASSFMGEPTKQYNMAMAAAYDARTSKGKAKAHAIGRLGRTAITLAITGIVNACAQSFIDALRDDDKERDYWEKWYDSFVDNSLDTANPLGYIPFAKDILSIFQGYDVKRMDTETITKTVNAIVNMYKAVTGTGKYTIAEASAALFADIARIYGVPVANIKRDVKSIATTVAIETDNYLMQYRMEKAMFDINYSGNRKNFIDILYNAYMNDREAYEFIYNDLIKSGYDSDTIQSNMETRMKKAEGVTKASELSERYMTPVDEKKYDNSLRQIQKSKVWGTATTEQRKEAEAELYNFLTSTSEGVEKLRTEAKAFGVDEVEYTLWQLAKEMSDINRNNSIDAKEKAKAIEMLDFGDREITYFYNTDQANEAYAYGIDMLNYALFKAAVSGLKGDDKKEKVNAYAQKYGDNEKERLYFVGTVYDSTKKEADYIKYFGK